MEQLNSTDVLNVFAQYGFQKTSMSDIAHAAGVSRQSLYNNFKSKDEIFEFVIRAYVEKLYEEAVSALTTNDGSVIEKLIKAYAIWIGSSVSLLHSTPHGAELLERGIQAHLKNSMDIEEQFAERIKVFITDHKLARDSSVETADIVYTLTMSAKGLLLKSLSEDDFRAGIQKIIKTLLVA